MIEAKSMMQSLGDVLFTGRRVYLLDEPDRVLKTKRINWSRESSDLEDREGRVFYDVPWDAQEFFDKIDYHFPDDE